MNRAAHWRDWQPSDIGPPIVVDVPGFDAGIRMIDPRTSHALDALIAAESGRPRLVPLFPITSFVPGSECPHHGPIREGSSLCCMACHASGMDGHAGLKKTADDTVKLKKWQPPEGGDQWTEADTATPTAYTPPPAGLKGGTG